MLGSESSIDLGDAVAGTRAAVSRRADPEGISAYLGGLFGNK
jgi:hypothetical protein